MHSLKSFIQQGLKERSTYIGLAIIIVGLLFGRQLYTLVSNVILAPSLVILIISKLPEIIGTLCVWYKEAKK